MFNGTAAGNVAVPFFPSSHLFRALLPMGAWGYYNEALSGFFDWSIVFPRVDRGLWLGDGE